MVPHAKHVTSHVRDAASRARRAMLCGVGSGTHQTSGCLVCDPPPPVLLYYVKFHKVGGTSLSLLLTELLVNNLRQWTSLSQPRFVAGPAKAAECEDGACIGHQSLQYWRMLSYDHQDPESLLSTMQRHAELRDVAQGAHPAWVPCALPSKSLLFVTLLRDPAERLRSKYYFRRAGAWCGEINCAAKNESFTEWMGGKLLDGVEANDAETCCEYTAAGGVAWAKAVVATHFDVIGITERFDEAVVEIVRHLSRTTPTLTYAQIPCPGNARANPLKEPWTAQERELAEGLVADDRQLYDYAARLSTERSLKHWGTEVALAAEARAMRKECHPPALARAPSPPPTRDEWFAPAMPIEMGPVEGAMEAARARAYALYEQERAHLGAQLGPDPGPIVAIAAGVLLCLCCVVCCWRRRRRRRGKFRKLVRDEEKAAAPAAELQTPTRAMPARDTEFADVLRPQDANQRLPPEIAGWVERCFAASRGPEQLASVRAAVDLRLEVANSTGSLWTTDWSTEPPVVVPPPEEVKAAEEGGATFHTTSAAVAAAQKREEKRQEMATLKKEPDYRAMLSSDAAKSLAFKDRWRIGS